MKGIVLAAGRGSRLSPITYYLPKPLLPVNGSRVIDKVLNYLRTVCEDILVVTGYMADVLERYLNRRYDVKVLKVDKVFPGNLYTLLRAKDFADKEEFIIANADHIFPKKVWNFFPKSREGVELACHRKERRKILEDEMKVRTEGDLLIFMDKRLENFQGAYVGLAYVSEARSGLLWEVAEEIFKLKGGNSKAEDVFNRLAQNRLVRVNYIDEVPFWEIDTVEDLRKVWHEARTRDL